MQLLLTAQGMTIQAPLRKRIERRLRFAAARFERHIREIAVHIRNRNGELGDLCSVSAKLHTGEEVSVAQEGRNASAAIGGAAKRLRHSLARRIERAAPAGNAGALAGATEYWIG